MPITDKLEPVSNAISMVSFSRGLTNQCPVGIKSSHPQFAITSDEVHHVDASAETGKTLKNSRHGKSSRSIGPALTQSVTFNRRHFCSTRLGI